MTKIAVVSDRRHVGGLRWRVLRRYTPLRYLTVGVAAFGVDLGTLALLHRVVGMSVWLATAVAFLVSFGFTYTCQRLAFVTTARHGSALARYTVLVAFNTVATAGIVQGLALTPVGWAGGKVVATLVTTAWNYVAYRLWVFPAREAIGG